MPRLSPQEAAKYLGLESAITLKNWRCCGVGPAFIRLGHRTIVYDTVALDRHCELHSCQPAVQAFLEEHGSRRPNLPRLKM